MDLKLSPNVTEDFFYDALNLFDYSQRNGTTNADVTLDTIGSFVSSPVKHTVHK